MIHLVKTGKQPIDFVSCATSILNLGRPIAEIYDTIFLTHRQVEKSEKWVRDAERNCGMNLNRSREALNKMKDAVRRKDLPDGIIAYDEFKDAVYRDVRDWAGVDLISRSEFSTEEAKKIGESLDIDWKNFDVEQFRMGLNVELEHGLVNPKTNVTNDDPILTGKITLAHLNELSDYYTRLKEMERV